MRSPISFPPSYSVSEFSRDSVQWCLQAVSVSFKLTFSFTHLIPHGWCPLCPTLGMNLKTLFLGFLLNIPTLKKKSHPQKWFFVCNIFHLQLEGDRGICMQQCQQLKVFRNSLLSKHLWSTCSQECLTSLHQHSDSFSLYSLFIRFFF